MIFLILCIQFSLPKYYCNKFLNYYCGMYSQSHKTLPKSSLQMHWISVRFYEMGDIVNINYYPFLL